MLSAMASERASGNNSRNNNNNNIIFKPMETSKLFIMLDKEN